MALGRQILDRPLDAAGNAVAGLPHAATGDAAERHDDVVAQVAAEAALRAAADALIPGTITALTGDVTASGTGAVAATLANLPQAVLLARTGALTADLPLNNRKITGQASGGATATNGANIADVNTAVAAEAAVRAAGDTTAISIAETFATNADAALLASLRTPKPGEFWVACVDQDGLTLAGSDTTGAIGIASPGQQTRVVTVTGADSAVASTKTLHFTNGGFTANDLYGELVIGNAANAGMYRIKTVSSATDVIVDGPIVNETFSGSVTLTVIGGPRATRDAALAAAKLTPFKTLDRLGAALPRFGNAASLVVLARVRSGGAAYTLADLTGPSDMTWARNLCGWAMVFFRPTDNFVNDLDDKIRSGYQILPGTNAGGYVATAGATVSNIPCQLAGGGAANIPAEVFTVGSGGVGGVIGYRLRFLSTTPTVALRNYAIMIHRSTASSVVPAKDLPAVPLPNTDLSGGDKFVIEQTAFWVFDGTLDLGINHRTVFIGVGSTGTVGQVSVECSTPTGSIASFMGWEAQPAVHFGFSGTNNNSTIVSEISVDEMGGYLPSLGGLITAIQVGVGFRARLDNFNQNSLTVKSSCDISDTPRTWSGSYGNHKIGPGCVFKSGVTWIRTDTGLNTLGASAAEAVDTSAIEFAAQVCTFGSDGSPGYRRTRLAAPFVAWCIGVIGGSVRIRGLEIDSAPAAVVNLGGIGTKVIIDDIIGTGGTIVGPIVDTSTLTATTPAYGCLAIIGTRVAVSASSTVGDIKLVDGTIVPFSTLASGFVEDSNGNRFVGTGGIVHAADSVPARSSATAGALADVPLTASTVLGRGASGHIAAIPFATIAGAGAGITALTGDVAATGPGSAAATIQPLAVDTGKLANSAVTNSKRANMAASTLSGNATGSPAAPTDLTAAAVKTLLAISATADVSGLAAIATSGSANDLIAGTLPAGRFPTLTGDVTTTAGSLATTLANLPQAVLIARTGALTAALPMNAQKITGVADPTNPQDAATKHYVDASFSGGVPLVDGNKGDITVSGSGATWLINALAVTFAKMQNIATQTLIGRQTAGTGPPESIGVGGGVEFDGAGNIRRSALTGDVSASAGSAGTVINANVVTNAQLAQVPTGTLKGRTAAGTGNTSDLTFAAVKSALAIVFADITGTLQAAQFPALTGDVTTPGGSLVTTLAATGVIAATYGDASHVAQVTVDAKGRVTAASSPSISITAGAVAGLSTTQTGALTGDVTKPAGSGTTTLANIPNDVPMVGDIVATAIADPAVPAAGTARAYLRSTGKVWASRDENGNVSHTVRTKAAVTHQFLTAIDDDGTVHGVQPSFPDISGVIDGSQFLLGADTIVGNNTGVSGPAQTLTPAQVRTMLGLDAPRQFDINFTFGSLEGLDANSQVPTSAFIGPSAFFLSSHTITSEVTAAYAGAAIDANLITSNVWEWVPGATFGSCEIRGYCWVFDPSVPGSSPIPAINLIVTRSRTRNSSPVSLDIFGTGAFGTGPTSYAFGPTDSVGIVMQGNAGFFSSGGHAKFTVHLRLTP